MKFEARISGSPNRKAIVSVDSKDAWDFVSEITQGIISYDTEAHLFDVRINGYDTQRIFVDSDLAKDGKEIEEYDRVAWQVIACIKDYIFTAENMTCEEFPEEDVEDAKKLLHCIMFGDWNDYR